MSGSDAHGRSNGTASSSFVPSLPSVPRDVKNSQVSPSAAGRLDAFEIVCLVGRGGFGKVLLVRMRDTAVEDLYAMKVMRKDVLATRNASKDALAERDILAILGQGGDDSCPFIVRLHAAFQTSSRLYLVMDFAAGGEIMWHLRQQAMLSEDHARFYAAELLLALEFLHERRILHRDIKPENVLLGADGHLLLTDFGLAKDLSGFDDPDAAHKHSWCGSEDYMAPEIIAREPHTGKPADWWAFGVFLYDCLVGNPPFSPLHEKTGKAAEKKSRKRLHDRIIKAKYRLPSYLTSECHSLIRALLTRDPTKRLSDPASIRAHPWFRGVDWAAARTKSLTPPLVPNSISTSPTAFFSPSLTQNDYSAPHSPLALSSPRPTLMNATASVSIPSATETQVDDSALWHGFSFVAPGMEGHLMHALGTDSEPVPPVPALPAAVPGVLSSGHRSLPVVTGVNGCAADSSTPCRTPVASPEPQFAPPPGELQLAAELAEFSLEASHAVRLKRA